MTPVEVEGLRTLDAVPWWRLGLRNLRCFGRGGHPLCSVTLLAFDLRLTWCRRCHPRLHAWVVDYLETGSSGRAT